MGTTAEKLNYLKETKTEIKNALETPSNIFRDYPSLIKKYINNQPTSKVSNGVCTNALDVPLVSLGIDGQSEQKQYDGYNLYNYKDVEPLKYINGDTGVISDSSWLAFCGYIPVKPNKTYSRSANGTGGNCCLDSNKNFISTMDGTTFTTPDNCYYVGFNMVYSDYYNTGLYKEFVMNEGDTLKPYEPYVGGQPSPNPNYPQDIEVIKGFEEGNQYGLPYGCIGLEHTNEDGSKSEIIPINLNGNSISKVEDVKDLLKIYRNGDVEIEKKIGKVVLDGSEDWINFSRQNLENTMYFYLIKSDMLNGSKLCSDKFINRSIYDIDNEGIQSILNKQIRLRINKARLEDYTTSELAVKSLKKWFSQHLTKTYYQLAEPQTIKLPSIEPITLWEGTNIFKLITNLDTTFEMEYVVNKDSVLNEVQTAMLEAEIEI